MLSACKLVFWLSCQRDGPLESIHFGSDRDTKQRGQDSAMKLRKTTFHQASFISRYLEHVVFTQTFLSTVEAISQRYQPDLLQHSRNKFQLVSKYHAFPFLGHYGQTLPAQ